MLPQLETLLVNTTKEIVTRGGSVAVGFDAAASEDNWGLCVLTLSSDLQTGFMPLLLPQARINADGHVSSSLLCRPCKEALSDLIGCLTTAACPVSIAVDVPFGWPDGHSDFISHWTAQTGWSGKNNIPPRQDFERRWCDIELRSRYPFLQPFSVGADTIAQAAFCWAVVRQELAQYPLAVDFGLEPVDQDVVLFETYPGAFVKLAASDFGNYKSKPAVRRNLLASLKGQYELTLSQLQWDWLEWACEQRGSPDAFDAFLCALSAWDHLKNRAAPGSIPLTTPSSLLQRQTESCEEDRIRREGWILVRSQ